MAGKDGSIKGPSPVKTMGNHAGKRSVSALLVIVGLAGSVRCWIWFMSPVLNPDGVLYIHQARLFYEGAWSKLTGCGISFFSVYPVLIAGAYPLFNDWETAARVVSILLGTLTVFPVYMIARHFAASAPALLTSIVFAVLPAASGAAGQVVRDLSAWFFLAWGVAFFMKQFEGEGFRHFAFLSGISFILASWARVEAILFIAVSVIYLVLWGGSRRTERVIFFLLPALLAALLGAISGHASGVDLERFFRFREVSAKIIEPFSAYGLLRSDIKVLSGSMEQEVLREFLSHARQAAWILAGFALVNCILRALLYLYAVPFVAGLVRVKALYSQKRLVLYPIMLCLAVLALLYLHIIHTWVTDARFAMILIIPALGIAAAGFERIMAFAEKMPIRPSRRAFLPLMAVILSIGLFNVAKFTERDKLVFKEIGEAIALDGQGEKIIFASSQAVGRWVSFYSNLESAEPPCPQQDFVRAAAASGDSAVFIRILEHQGVTHIIFEERGWPKGEGALLALSDSGRIEEIGSWSHPSTGRLIAYRIRR